MKPLSDRQRLILSGGSNLSKEKVDKYRVLWYDLGYDIPPELMGDGPTPLRKAANVVKAVGGHIANGMKKAPEDVQLMRLALCEACPWYEAGICKHPDCGCNMKIKVGWASSRCPLDPPVWDQHTP